MKTSKEFTYHTLDDDALKVVESSGEVHALFLDFLAYLHDAVCLAEPATEPPYFSRAIQTQRLDEIILQLPNDASLAKIARENAEKAFALADHTSHSSFQKFFRDLCGEYNVVRSLGQYSGHEVLQPVPA